MCKPEQCPLQAICVERIEVAEAILNMQQAEIDAIGGDQGENAESISEDLVFAVESIKRYASTLRINELGYEIQGEKINQTIENMHCKGPSTIRQFGYFGKVMAKNCGSAERRARLSAHLERKALIDEATIEGRAEE